jgi:HEAT repeat protein
VLDHVTGRASSSRLRRSSVDDTNTDTLLRASLLDSIGNSGDPNLFPRLVEHVTGEDSLGIKHAAVKAIGRYDTSQVCKGLCLSDIMQWNLALDG